MSTQAQQTMQACGFNKDSHQALGAEGGALWIKAQAIDAAWCPDQRQIEFKDGSRIRFVPIPESLYGMSYLSQ